MRFLPDIYDLAANEISRIQSDLLIEAVDRAVRTSPFYRDRAANAAHGYRIRSIDDLANLPLTTKRDIQKRNRDLRSTDPVRIREIVATTGTTGAPVYVPMTESDIDRLAENERRGFSWMGTGPGDLFHIAVTMDNLFVAGLAYQAGLRKVGAAAIRVGAQPASRHLDLMRQLRPDGIVAVPSLLLALARQAESSGEDLHAFAPKRALLIGDAIRGRDLRSNTLGCLLEENWGGELFSTYGLTEAGLAFHECQARQGLHSHPDLVIVEVVDDAGLPLPDGEAGELVVTTLQVEAMPLIRYCTGDIAFRIPGVCPCGRAGARIGPILGRKQQRMKVKGTTLYPKVLEDALLSVDGVVNYIIEAHTGEDRTDRIVVRVGAHSDDPCLKKRVSDTLFAKARVTPEVRLEPPPVIDGIQYEGGRRKPRLFLDLRKTEEGSG